MTYLADSANADGSGRRAEPAVADDVSIVPIRHGRRTVGAYVMTPEGMRFHPATDITRIVVTALTTAALTAAAIAIAAAVRRPPAIRSVTMGPGGWVSLRGTTMPPARSGAATSRPWWARALGARRLVVERR
jgi:hypothetical protein